MFYTESPIDFHVDNIEHCDLFKIDLQFSHLFWSNTGFLAVNENTFFLSSPDHSLQISTNLYH